MTTMMTGRVREVSLRLLLLMVAAMAQQQQQQEERHLLVTLPLSRWQQQQDEDSMFQRLSGRVDGDRNLGYSHAAAVLLALDHYHERNDTVVKGLRNLTQKCNNNVTWRVTMADSESTGSGSVDALLKEVQAQPVDAVIGGYQYGEMPALELTAAANSQRIPSVMYGGSNLRVVSQRYYPYSSRTHPDGLAFGVPLMEYLVDSLNRTNYFGLLAPSFSEVALQNQNVLVEVADTKCIQTHVAQYQPNEYIPGPSAEQALKELKKTGFRTLLLLLDDWELELPIVANAAVNLSMPFEDYVWVLVGNLDLMSLNRRTLSDEVLQLLRGSLYVQPLELFGWYEDDPFLLAWQHPSDDFVSRLNSLVPTTRTATYFTDATKPPEMGSGFAYDATMAVLLGASCIGDSSPKNVTERIQASSFQGATGLVEFQSAFAEYPGSRAHYTLPFGLYNVLIPGMDATLLTAVRAGGTSAQDASMSWMVKMPFVFANAHTTGPPLRDDPNGNYLNPAVRAIGLVLFAIVITMIIVCSLWTVWNRKARIVRAAQPPFCQALMLGSALVALAVPLNSMDESFGWTAEQLSKACTATPWMIVCGLQIIYSALWVKLWRIQKVLQFKKRGAVSITAVIWPAAVLFVLVLILLAVWTAVDGGFTWIRTTVDEFTGESTAKCVGKHSVAYFTPILILMFVPVLLTLILSWKTKDVASEYSENLWLLALVVFQVQLLLITIPLFMLVEDSMSTVRYIVQAIVSLLFSACAVGLVMIPKMVRHHKKDGDNSAERVGTAVKRGSSMGVRVSGLHRNTSTTLSGRGYNSAFTNSSRDLQYHSSMTFRNGVTAGSPAAVGAPASNAASLGVGGAVATPRMRDYSGVDAEDTTTASVGTVFLQEVAHNMGTAAPTSLLGHGDAGDSNDHLDDTESGLREI